MGDSGGYSKPITWPQCGLWASFGYNAAQSKITFPDFPEFMISKPSR